MKKKTTLNEVYRMNESDEMEMDEADEMNSEDFSFKIKAHIFEIEKLEEFLMNALQDNGVRKDKKLSRMLQDLADQCGQYAGVPDKY